MPGSHRSDNPVPYHTILKDELVKRYGTDYPFRNQLFLPLGLTFSHFMAEDAGEHKVELHYRNPFLVPALVVTLASLLILAAGLWRWPRIGLPA